MWCFQIILIVIVIPIPVAVTIPVVIIAVPVAVTIPFIVIAISARLFFSAGTIFADAFFQAGTIFLGTFIASVVGWITPVLPDFGRTIEAITAVALGQAQVGDQDHGYQGQ